MYIYIYKNITKEKAYEKNQQISIIGTTLLVTAALATPINALAANSTTTLQQRNITITDSQDLAPFIDGTPTLTNISRQNASDQNSVSAYGFDDLQFGIKFKLTANDNASLGGKTWIYKLPDQIKIKSEFTEDIKDSNQKKNRNCYW